jgi:hypothetical protein
MTRYRKSKECGQPKYPKKIGDIVDERNYDAMQSIDWQAENAARERTISIDEL